MEWHLVAFMKNTTNLLWNKFINEKRELVPPLRSPVNFLYTSLDTLAILALPPGSYLGLTRPGSYLNE